MGMAKSMMNEWLRHRTVLPEVLANVPAEQVNFVPWEGALSLGKLTVHIVTTTQFFLTAVQTGEFNRPVAPEFASMDDVVRIAGEFTASSKAIYESLDDEKLNGILEASFMGMTAPKHVFLGAMRDHEVHHKGQLFVYARMAGAKEMPFFISRG